MTEYLAFTADWSSADAVAVYDDVSLWSSLAGRLMLDNVPLRAGMRVLDVGCGAGFPLLELAQRLGPNARAVGIDPWRRALGRATFKRRVWDVRHASLVAGDAVALPFREASFDLVVSNLGLNNFDDPAAAVRECARVLRRDARIAITTNLQGHMREFYAEFEAVLRECDMRAELSNLEAHVRHRATVDGVRALFADAGLHVCRVVEDHADLRFADGSAFFRHYFIKAAFLGAWRDIMPVDDRARIFGAVERRLNAIAAREGELRLRVPLAYIEAQRASA
jgi:ubiquinone/menaquinone biosynthesis C-methylase UbiE